MTNLSIAVAAIGLTTGLVYVVVFGLLLPGRMSIYAFIVATFLWPNFGTYYFGFGDLPAYFFVEIIAALAVVLAMLRTSRSVRERQVYSTERRICNMLTAAVVAHYVVYWPLRWAGYYPTEPTVEAVATNAIRVFVSLCFLYGCVRFIHTIEQVERVCWLFVLCGVELLAERIVFGVGAVPFVAQYAFDEVGRFKSLTENDPISVGVFASVATLCALYFSFNKKRLGLLLVLPLWLLAFTTYQRTFMVGTLFAAGFFLWRASASTKRHNFALAVLGALAIISVTGDVFTPRLESIYADTWRGQKGPDAVGFDPLGTAQLESRIGIQARALDVFVYLFPFGTGEFVQRDYLSSSIIPTRFRPMGIVADDAYLEIAAGLKSTELHNGYLEHIVAYGMLGILSLMVFLAAAAANIFDAKPSDRILHGLVSAVLAFFAVFFMFYSFPKVYVAYFFFFHASFLLSRRTGSATATVSL